MIKALVTDAQEVMRDTREKNTCTEHTTLHTRNDNSATVFIYGVFHEASAQQSILARGGM